MKHFPNLPALFLAVFVSLTPMVLAKEKADIIQKNDSQTGKYRVVWTSDPTTTATIAWDQKEGDPAKVHYGKKDFQRRAGKYPHSIKPQRVQEYDGMVNCFARLRGLEPDTEYFFCLVDASGTGPRFKFRTAPRQPKAFTFIAGGDSRNYRDVRVEGNQLCEKLRPLFVAFTGDMINQDVAEEWDAWLDDWQETIGEDGTMIPIVPHRGNHERRPETITNYFDTPEDAYFAFSIGGKLFRYYALNSEIPAIGDQEKWLEKDLAKSGKKVIHLVAGYHKPMRPHVSKKSEGTNPMAWADNFYEHGFDLALESDSHVMKRTLPLKPDPDGPEGFRAAPNDPNATVYIGEGCWGAPLRPADDAKPWTLDTESFNGFEWIRVSPESIEVKTVRIKNAAGVEPVDPSDPYRTPDGLNLWEAEGGTVLTVPAD
tara:strand:+ start:146 stop:1426 length:1281 start_codon:yes stop_codon:yes gene_type:complete